MSAPRRSPDLAADRWRRDCVSSEPDGGREWAEPESSALVEAMIEAIRADDAGGPPRAERMSRVDRATRRWTRMQPSLSVLASRLHRIREVLADEDPAGAGRARLGDLCGLVVATANEEFALRMQDAALSDPLTGTGNRRALESAWQAATAQARRNGLSVCVVAIDVDGLKRINDFQGHAAGDDTIVRLSAALRAALRDTDQVFRIGGDEFVALLPGTAAAAAVELMARVNQYQAPRFSWGAGDTVQDGATLGAVLGCADRRLYGQRRRARPPTTSLIMAAPAPRPSMWSGLSRRRGVELAIAGALALAIGAIVTSISGGNDSICGGGDGPTVVDCGLSNAVYFGGIVLVAVGSVILGLGLTTALVRGPGTPGVVETSGGVVRGG